jgi:hypothetical protein
MKNSATFENSREPKVSEYDSTRSKISKFNNKVSEVGTVRKFPTSFFTLLYFLICKTTNMMTTKLFATAKKALHKTSFSSLNEGLIQFLFMGHLKLRHAFSLMLICAAILASSNSISAQSQISQRNDFLTEKKRMAKKVTAEERLELSKKDIEFIDASVKDLKVEIEQVKKDAKKAKLFKEEEKYQALEAKLESLRQMARDFKMIKTKSLTAI